MENKITLISSQALTTGYALASGIAEFLQNEGQAVLQIGYKAGTNGDSLQVRVDTSSDKTLFFGEVVEQSSSTQTLLATHEYSFTDVAGGSNRTMFGDILGLLEAVDNGGVQTYTSNLQRLKFSLPPVTASTPVIYHNGTAFGTVTEKANVAAFTAPGTLAAGTVEWALSTGELNFSAADLVSYVGQEIKANWVTNYNLFVLPINIQDKFIKVGLKNTAAGGAGTGFCLLSFTAKAGTAHQSSNINVDIGDVELGAVELKDSDTDVRANIKAANTARTTATVVIATQPIDEAGLVLGRDAANTARTVATKVNSVQQIGADGTVPPTGSLNTNAPFSKLTDGTSNLTLGTGTVKTIPSAINDGTTMVVVETDGTKKALNVNVTDGTNDMPTMDAAARKGFVAITDGTSTVDIGIDESALAVNPEFLPIGGEYRAAETTYTDGDATIIQTDINGYIKNVGKNYDSGTTSNKVYEVAGNNTKHIEESVTLTNIANVTPQYVYLDMDGFRYWGAQWAKSGGADTYAVTIEATLQDDGTAQASCTYIDVTAGWFGVASWTASDLIQADKVTSAKYVRLKFTTAGGGNDADFTVYTKKLF